jgi:hypothetical protein
MAALKLLPPAYELKVGLLREDWVDAMNNEMENR